MNRKLAAILSLLVVSILLSWGISSCRRNPALKNLHLATIERPDNFPTPYYNFDAENPLTEEGIALGRKLFYDPILAGDDEHSCASCHEQRSSFGTFQHDRSHGFNETHTLRNAPVLLNLAWSPYLHWDGEFNSLESVSLQPITGDHEMGGNFITIINRLERDHYYNKAFREVFRTPFIRREFITRALAQFIGTLVSFNSKYDQYKKGATSFTPEELNGYNVFKAKCNSCHTEPLFTNYSFKNIGLAVDPALNDYGRMRITGNKEDSLKFKVPTLRNVQTSSNYMHDGRFITLYQCINHYRTGVIASSTLDPLLQNGITISNADAQDLVSFLKTLTDSSFLVNPRYKDPNN
jgi:cytochrome c peroxidase